MPKDFISVNTTKNLGADLVNAKETLRNVFDRLEWLRDTALHNIDDPDYADFEANFGIPTGAGQTVYNVLNTTVNQLGHGDIQTFFERIHKT